MAYSIEQNDAQLRNTSAAIRYHLSFPQAPQHLTHVRIDLENSADEVVLAMPNWIPGSYKIRDFIAYQGDVRVTDFEGRELHAEWISKNRLRVDAGGRNVRASYTYYGNERSVRQTHVNRNHAFINPANCMMYVEGRMDEVHHVELEHPWKHVSTSLSPVRQGVWGALNYDILADSPLEIGDHYVASYERHGAVHEIAITGVGDFDPDWITAQTERIIDHAIEMWGSLPYDRYVFIIQLVPGLHGGLEHARSSVNMADSEVFSDRKKVVSLLWLLCHEYFHLWNVKRIRPVELGPFDYNIENYTRMLWLAEGVTSYYDHLITYRCGFYTRSEYLKVVADENFAKLLQVPGRLAMSVKDSGYLSWVKLYMPTPDSTNRFPSYYLKGGVVFMLLDLAIITETDGVRSLDDGMRALMERYHADPGTGITEEEFITIVSRATGVDIRDRLLAWLDGAVELPVEEVLAGLGLEWRAKKPEEQGKFGADLDFITPAPERWMGMQVEDFKTGVKIGKVWRDSPAEAAGLGVDDEVIAVNGIRVTNVRQLDAIVRGNRESTSIRITGASEGKLYETTLTFAPRVSWELVEREGITDAERARLDRWLRRSALAPEENVMADGAEMGGRS